MTSSVSGNKRDQVLVDSANPSSASKATVPLSFLWDYTFSFLSPFTRKAVMGTSLPFLVYFVGKLNSVCLLRVRESSVLVFSCYNNLAFVRISASLNKLGLKNEMYCIFNCVYMCKCMCVRMSIEARRRRLITWSWC